MLLNVPALTILSTWAIFSAFALGTIKVTIFLTYLELFSVLNWIRLSCYVGIALTSVFYLVLGVLYSYWGFPHGHESIVQYYVSLGNTNGPTPPEVASVPMSSVGLVIDIYLFIVPLLAVSRLRMTLRKKLGAASIFTAGFL